MRLLIKTITALTLGSACASQAVSAASSDTWRFEVTPYLLAAGMDGTVGVRGVEADIDVSFSDVLDVLDSGFMGIFSAHKGPWTLAFEAVYMKLENEGAGSVSGPFGNVTVNGALELTSRMYVYQGTVGYRILDDTTKLDLLGAVRYTKLQSDMDVKIATVPGIVFPGGATSASGSDSWFDGVVGMHVLHPVSDKVSLVGYADVGGGGSDITYQFLGGVDWAFREGFSAKFGYRYLYWDYEDGGTVWDVAASGPYMGLGIQF